MKGVILDIDRTLVHSVEKYILKMEGKEEEWKDKFKWFDIDTHITFLRPNVWEFIDFLFTEGFEVGIFTAGSDDYAKQIVDNLFVGRDLKFVLSNNHYEEAFYKYRKDKPIEYVVEKYGGEERLSHWLIIDDSSNVKRYNGDKCYKIKPFCICYDDTFDFREESLTDDELVKCMEYLKKNK
jgi:phosphoglycolate phosphatase-like HAD superfamily hydrolase